MRTLGGKGSSRDASALIRSFEVMRRQYRALDLARHVKVKKTSEKCQRAIDRKRVREWLHLRLSMARVQPVQMLCPYCAHDDDRVQYVFIELERIFGDAKR
jgi:Zn finger protein HypA/HybF involved in hydrogenase expression